MSRAARHAAILCLALPACARAAGGDPWIKVTSANFELYTTAGERAGRDLVRHFEQVRSFFTQAFGSRLAQEKPARIVAFRNDKEYAPYRPNGFATAFYQPGESHDFIVMSGSSSDHYRVAVHEFTHLMVHQSGQVLPPWFNEGLAELFSNLEPMGNRIKVGQDIPGRMQMLRSEPWIDLRTLLAVDQRSPYYNDRSHAGMFYAESWQLVHMLYLSPSYSPRLKAMAAALKTSDAETAMQTAYHKGIDEVEADLREYLRGDTIKVLVFPIQLPKSVETPEIETSAGLPARLALAELLSNYRGHTEQARAAYESLAREFPTQAEVEEEWGRFAWRQRRLDDAARHFTRAMELGDTSPRLYIDYGRVLYYTNRLPEAIEVLGKAQRLNPGSDEISFELGSVYLRHDNYGAAVSALRSIKKVMPAQAYNYYYNLALGEYRLGDFVNARTDAAKARTYTRNPEELSSLDRLGRALDVAGARGGPAVEGMLETLECGKLARLHVRVDGAVRIFVIPGDAAGLECGAQNPPRAVRIEYQVLPAESDVAGLVRSLEFK